MLISDVFPQSKDIEDVTELKIELCAFSEGKLISVLLGTDGFYWKNAIKCFYCASKINDFVSKPKKLEKEISVFDIKATGSPTTPISVDEDDEFSKFDSVQIIGRSFLCHVLELVAGNSDAGYHLFVVAKDQWRDA